MNSQVIVMGADVTHPGADQQDSGKPSIAAVVASVDPKAAQYICEIRIQKSKQEYIEDMENMVYNLLLKFNKTTGSTSTGKPQRIIFYRDGVSEGQFAKVIFFRIWLTISTFFFGIRWKSLPLNSRFSSSSEFFLNEIEFPSFGSSHFHQLVCFGGNFNFNTNNYFPHYFKCHFHCLVNFLNSIEFKMQFYLFF